VHASCVFLAYDDFIAGCIVFGPFGDAFWSMSELMSFLKMLDSCNHLQMKFR
jgi:hypothetical protein